MAAHMFLLVDGIEGESVAEDFRRQVEVTAWEWGVSQSGGAGPGQGAGAGRVSVRELMVSHQVDAASTGLLQACVRGTRLRRAVLSVTSPDDEGALFLTVELRDVRVVSVTAGAGEGRPVETVALAGQEFEVTYVEQRPDGSRGQVHQVSWDTSG